MVVQMKKLQMLLPARERESFLAGLAEVGVVHLEEKEGQPASSDLEKIDASIKKYRQVADTVPRPVSAADLSTSAERSSVSAQSVAEDFYALQMHREQMLQKIAGLEKDATQLYPWGDFDPQLLHKLEIAGVSVRFFEAPAKTFEKLDLTEACSYIVKSEARVFFVVFEYRQEPIALDAEEVVLPSGSLRSIQQTIADLNTTITETEKKIASLSRFRAVIDSEIQKLENAARFERARSSLESGAEGAVLFLCGWLPISCEKKLNKFLSSKTVWFEIRHPEKDEQPPIKLKNGSFVEKFEPITGMFALPSYFELDPTPFFAPFFMFFYGMCLGDVGYGLIVLIAAIILVVREKSKKMRNIFILGLFLGVATILNGFFLNSFFGAPLFNVTGVDGLLGSGGAIPFLGSQVIDGKTEFPAITFAIYIGIIQMILGMVLQIVNKWRQQGVVYAIQPFCYIPLTLSAFVALCKVNFLNMGAYVINDMPIGAAVAQLPATVLFTLLGVGIIPFVFFNTPGMKIWLRPLKFIWELYNFVNGMVSNGLSYLRLFALGLAGGLLGSAFNQIALMLITDSNGEVTVYSPMIVFTILIMIAGHALNFALSALGAYVHSVRLTFVEFYNNLSFQGGGKPYIPFSVKQ